MSWKIGECWGLGWWSEDKNYWVALSSVGVGSKQMKVMWSMSHATWEGPKRPNWSWSGIYKTKNHWMSKVFTCWVGKSLNQSEIQSGPISKWSWLKICWNPVFIEQKGLINFIMTSILYTLPNQKVDQDIVKNGLIHWRGASHIWKGSVLISESPYNKLAFRAK